MREQPSTTSLYENRKKGYAPFQSEELLSELMTETVRRIRRLSNGLHNIQIQP